MHPHQRMLRLAPRLAVLVLGAVLSACSAPRDDKTLTVLAAASLADALQAVGEAYGAETGGDVRFSFAASSTLARQIEAGAPADLYMSANVAWMDHLAERGLIDADTRAAPIGNRLALITSVVSTHEAGDVGATITADLRYGLALCFAVADPDHAPAGQYAKEALEHLNLWEEVEPRLARTLDVRGALAFVERGECRLGAVYATDAAISPKVRVVGLFPEESHTPITYPIAIIAGARSEEAERFLAYVTGESGLAIFERFGFVRL